MERAISEDGSMVELRSDGTWARTSSTVGATGDFRGVPWGVSKDYVRDKEAQPATYEGDDLLVYPQRLSDMDAEAVYIFLSGRLVRAKYIFREEFTNENRYIDAYYRVKALFSGKYGEPKDDHTIWRDDLYRDDPDDWGRAVERGDLTFMTTWATPATELALLLHGNNFQSHLEVEYTSVLLQPWAESTTTAVEHDLI